jgi:beta-glucanase (GH16 family)
MTKQIPQKSPLKSHFKNFFAILFILIGFSNQQLLAATSVAEQTLVHGGIPKGWKKVWSEEFSVNGLPNEKIWNYDISRNKIGWHNNEAQYYSQKRLKNTVIKNGHLLITAHKEDLSSFADWGGQKYSSARIDTKNKKQLLYGFFEIRAKLPCGGGTWPALWMLGESGSWPAQGEIDIMEHIGPKPGVIMGTIHNSTFFADKGKTGNTLIPSSCSQFHRYQMRWDKDRITFGVDDKNYHQYLNPMDGKKETWPFDQNLYFIINLAIGGNLGGPIDDKIFPVTLDVDYIRIYQQAQTPKKLK